MNTGAAARTFYISTRHAALGAGGRPLARGWTRDDDGAVTPCTTFVLLARGGAAKRGAAAAGRLGARAATLTPRCAATQVPPRTLMAVAHLQLAPGEALSLDSDVQDCVVRPAQATRARTRPPQPV